MRNMRYVFKSVRYILLIFLCVLSGCAGRRSGRSRDYFREQEARFVDVPIPLDAKPLPVTDISSGYTTLMRFKTAESYEELQDFYVQEMERYGWDITAAAHPEQTLYNCYKPTRWCSIIILPDGKKRSVVSIFIGQ